MYFDNLNTYLLRQHYFSEYLLSLSIKVNVLMSFLSFFAIAANKLESIPPLKQNATGTSDRNLILNDLQISFSVSYKTLS